MTKFHDALWKAAELFFDPSFTTIDLYSGKDSVGWVVRELSAPETKRKPSEADLSRLNYFTLVLAHAAEQTQRYLQEGEHRFSTANQILFSAKNSAAIESLPDLKDVLTAFQKLEKFVKRNPEREKKFFSFIAKLERLLESDDFKEFYKTSFVAVKPEIEAQKKSPSTDTGLLQRIAAVFDFGRPAPTRAGQ